MQEWILLNQKNPFLHCIFQTANLYSCIFLFPGGKLQAGLRLTTDWDSDIAGGFLFGWYPLSDAERKILPPSHTKISEIFHTVSSAILFPVFFRIVSGSLQSPRPVYLSHERGFLPSVPLARE